jgi:hypothetical protein
MLNETGQEDTGAENNSDSSLSATKIEKEKKKKRYFKLSITGSGGEYTVGIISDKDKRKALEKLAEDGDLDFYNIDASEETGLVLSCYENDNVLHSYGINIEGDYSASIDELNSPKENDYLSLDDTIWDSRDAKSEDQISFATLNNPWIDEEREEPDSLVLFGYKGEKKIESGYLIETEYDLNIKYIVGATTLMDETFGYDDDVLDTVYYFEKEVFIPWVESEMT